MPPAPKDVLAFRDHQASPEAAGKHQTLESSSKGKPITPQVATQHLTHEWSLQNNLLLWCEFHMLGIWTTGEGTAHIKRGRFPKQAPAFHLLQGLPVKPTGPRLLCDHLTRHPTVSAEQILSSFQKRLTKCLT